MFGFWGPRVEHSVQGLKLPLWQEVMALSESFKPLVAGDQRASLTSLSPLVLPIQVNQKDPLPGPSLPIF